MGQPLPAQGAFVATSLLHEPRLDPRRAADNIRLTAGYLRSLIDELGRNERLGVGAYLQGSTSVRAQGLAPETVAYVNQLEALRTAFDRARPARRPHPRRRHRDPPPRRLDPGGAPRRAT